MSSGGPGVFDVVIAMGSNLGNRAESLRRGLQELPKHGVQVLRTSGLYETTAAYITDQPPFLNAAALARTALPPLQLLEALKAIEAAAGRDLQHGRRWGPRPLDLDIICYGGMQLALNVPAGGEGGAGGGAGTGASEVHAMPLLVPHQRWHERPFVMAPLADLLYRSDLRDRPVSGTLTLEGGAAAAAHSVAAGPSAGTTSGTASAAPVPTGSGCRSGQEGQHSALPFLEAASRRWQAWREQRAGQQPNGSSTAGSSSEGTQTPAGGGTGGVGTGPAAGVHIVEGGDVMRRVTPLRDGRQLCWGDRTWLMGILNVTPDSFSDGGRNVALGDAVRSALAMARDGADIIDVGGQSTRPGAPRLSAGEEAARVVPVINALRDHPELSGTLLSVDTFYADVARQAVEAGADIVNDVSGGALDPDMLRQVSELGVPYVLMHMRGDPQTMQSAEHTAYGPGGAWREVGEELQAAAERAMAAGVPAWNIILDPGIGFAKTAEHNLDLLRNLRRLRSGALQGPFVHAPMLMGPSRKGFLGRLTGRALAADRDAATVAAAVVCVEGGADVVRAHNVAAVRDGLRVADAVYR